MFIDSAELCDPLYRAFQHFAAEAAAVAQLIGDYSPSAQSILDIGCGAAEYGKHLSETFGFRVDGLDLDHGLLAVAKAKMPTAAFFEADMADFDLQRQYDVIRGGPGTDRFALIGDLTVTRTAFSRIEQRTSVLEFSPRIGERIDGPPHTRTLPRRSKLRAPSTRPSVTIVNQYVVQLFVVVAVPLG